MSNAMLTGGAEIIIIAMLAKEQLLQAEDEEDIGLTT